ncbi:MAG: DUF2066 domain-containing protein, partial [Candidatus Competibacterales bacterium]|nr:DUF2066 domain-containing protein [Candidatus Competibacterales bacterium]
VTVVWLLAPNSDGTRGIWGRVEVDERFPALRDTANRRGIPIRVPEMDIEDRSAISTMDLIAEDAARLDAASARYDARHVLLVRLHQTTPNLFEAQWTLLRDEQDAKRWSSLGQDANLALAEGFAQYANHLAREYALKLAPGWVQSARVRVVGIDAIGGYARAMAYLQRLNLVESVQPTEVLGNDVVFLVEFEGSLGDLERSIEVGGLLIPAPEEPPAMPQMSDTPAAPGTASPQPAPTPPAAQPQAQQPEVSGLSFFAVSRRPELRYQLAQ